MVFTRDVLYMALDAEKDKLCFVVVAVVLFFAYLFYLSFKGPKAFPKPEENQLQTKSLSLQIWATQNARHVFRNSFQNESKMMQQNVDATREAT